MGSQLRTDLSTTSTFSCSGTFSIPASSIRPHQITAGVTSLTIPCASELFPAAGDYPLFYDPTGLHVLGAVTPYDPNLIAEERIRPRTNSRLGAAETANGERGGQTESGEGDTVTTRTAV